MGKVTIRQACLRDGSYVAANMKPEDRREIACQVAEGMTNWELAYMLIMAGGSRSHVAYLDGNPEVLFGVTPVSVNCLSAWAIGTRHGWRCIPAVTDYWHDMIPTLIDEGFNCMEARSIEGHTEAHAWLKSCGARSVAEPFRYGKGGELFHLFRWTSDDYHAISKKRRRWIKSNKKVSANVS